MINNADSNIVEAANQNDFSALEKRLNEGENVNVIDEMKNNALFYAVRNQNKEMVAKLLKAKINVNNQNIVGQTALHLAVRVADEDIIDMLLKDGADMELENTSNDTPVSYAIKARSLEILKIFERYGLENEISQLVEKLLHKRNQNLLNICEQACQKIFSKDSFLIEDMKILFNELETNKKEIFTTNLDDFTKMMEKTPEFKNANDQEKFNYLIFTKTWFVNFLLNNKGQFYPALLNIFIHCANQEEFHKNNTLFLALSMQDMSLFMMVMQISSEIKELTEKYLFFKTLSEVKKINFNEQNNAWGNTYLHFMISNGQSQECVDFINILSKIDPKEKCGLNVNILSPVYGTGALHLAIAKGYRDLSASGQSVLSYLDLVESLIQAGGDVNLTTQKFLEKQKLGTETEKIETPSEQTPLHIACARRDVEMIDILMRHGADPSLTNAAGMTPSEVLNLPMDKRKEIVDSISGPDLNNFTEYEKGHATQEHLRKCEAIIMPARKKPKF